MTTAILDAKFLDTKPHEFDVEDVEYLRHGNRPLLARVFKPRGEGPFPALVECHGGAWCLSDRTTERLRHQAMASHGIVSIALDFRSGNEDPYPASVQDINYAVRWAKRNAIAWRNTQESTRHLQRLCAINDGSGASPRVRGSVRYRLRLRANSRWAGSAWGRLNARLVSDLCAGIRVGRIRSDERDSR